LAESLDVVLTTAEEAQTEANLPRNSGRSLPRLTEIRGDTGDPRDRPVGGGLAEIDEATSVAASWSDFGILPPPGLATRGSAVPY
jgi:hypothetical protein